MDGFFKFYFKGVIEDSRTAVNEIEGICLVFSA